MAHPDSKPVRIRDMPWEEMRDLLRVIGPEIGRLAKRGDQFAIKVMARMQYAWEHPKDLKAHNELRAAVEDYVGRELHLAERFNLGSRFGHRLPEPEKASGPRIFMPQHLGRQ